MNRSEAMFVVSSLCACVCIFIRYTTITGGRGNTASAEYVKPQTNQSHSALIRHFVDRYAVIGGGTWNVANGTWVDVADCSVNVVDLYENNSRLSVRLMRLVL